MVNSIFQQVYDEGQKLVASTGNLTDQLNQSLNRLVLDPFRAATGFVEDAHGQKTDIFGTLIYTASKSKPTPETSNFNSDNVACVIDVCDIMDVEKFRASYERIACAKRFAKSPVPSSPDAPHTTTTLGIIFSRDTKVPIEELTEELDSLNRKHPNREWTDMVAVLSIGVINYAVQFPGEHVSGDFLPPAQGASDRYLPPIYVIALVRPTGKFTFNKMFSYLMGHLMLFSPGSKQIELKEILGGTPVEGMALYSYQYNLNGRLKPVPRQFHNDRYMPPRPFRIEDLQGNLLSTLQFIPWQDGGVILLKGKLPLDGFIIFLGRKALERGRIINLIDKQISFVLPITHVDFMQMLNRICKQTNMVVKADQTKFVIQKMAEEGSSSPFMARLYLGNLRLRDTVFPDHSERNKFDKPYQLLMETLLNTRSAATELTQLLDDHFKRLSKGEIGRLSGNTIHIDESIDKDLRKNYETFINTAVRVLKNGMQRVTEVLHVNIGFLFKKQGAFENGLRALEKTDPSLAAYLGETRKWSERLIECRNDIEHNVWVLPNIKYMEISGAIRAEEPKISDQTVSDFVNNMIDRLCCFVEEVTVHCLQAKMPKGISVMEIPVSQRDQVVPQRFQLIIADGGMPMWTISSHQSLFEEV